MVMGKNIIPRNIHLTRGQILLVARIILIAALISPVIYLQLYKNQQDNQMLPQPNKIVSTGTSGSTSAPTTGTAPKNFSQTVVVPPKNIPPPSKVIFSDSLGGENRLVTNEFVHWSKTPCPYTSSSWDMTSGTLLIKNGAGYSGIPTIESGIACDSSAKTNSAIFRLNTKKSDFSNVTISMDYNAVAHGGGGAPSNDYDGIHIWVGYQDQYSLYAATIYRWDGIIVTKKKVPENIAKCPNPSNDGCYYSLAHERTRKDITTANTWHHVSITFSTDASGLVHITTIIDGVTVADVVDTDPHGPSYKTGAVGVRGDNTEFYFKNFTVEKI